MLKCGLLGRKLGHSYSPAIHKSLCGYEYTLFEKEEGEIARFLRDGEWNGLNVTIPYKKTVVPLLDSLGEAAQETGSVNTIVKKTDGSLYGDNTDVYGFLSLVRRSGAKVNGKKTLVLGSGGASAAVCAAIKRLGGVPVVISRSGTDNYDNISRHADAEIIVNTTPLGMYPETGVSPIDLCGFPQCRAVFDVIYNPARTRLLLDAERLSIPYENGLYMLVAQAKKSAELFTGDVIPDEKTDRVYSELKESEANIVLIGMPGCGKSTAAREIGKITGRTVLDCDSEIERRTGKKPSQIIIEQGEDAFRDIESAAIADLGKRSGAVIATGGGSVLREENYDALHQNGVIIWLSRDISNLSCEDRPVSQKYGTAALFAQREPRYRRFADAAVDISLDAQASAAMILSAYHAEIEK